MQFTKESENIATQNRLKFIAAIIGLEKAKIKHNTEEILLCSSINSLEESITIHKNVYKFWYNIEKKHTDC